jgi:hypothetical protein
MALPTLSRHTHRMALWGGGLALAAGAALSLLIALPFSTSQISSTQPADALDAPTPDFHIGPLEWPVSHLARVADLEPFRLNLRSACGSLAGVEAAVCFSNHLARTFPHGSPQTEFVNPGFQPVGQMLAHLHGEPGHCLSRSGLLAAALLASGIPSRVVHILSPELAGHTVVEVWSAADGWTVVDPTFGRFLRSHRGAPNAWALVVGEQRLEWIATGETPLGIGDPSPLGGWTHGTVIYPDPWLYLRIGDSRATWLYRGLYVVLRPAHLAIGPAQAFLAPVIVVSSVGTIGCLGFVLLACFRTWREASFRAKGPGFIAENADYYPSILGERRRRTTSR